MSYPHGEPTAMPLTNALVTAVMNPWMTVDAYGDMCLFGFAQQHPRTGGLSWVLSTAIVEITPLADRARTASGRVYQLGHRISAEQLDEEGRIALRLLCSTEVSLGYENDRDWVIAQKMSRHLRINPPPNEPTAVEHFMQRNLHRYLALQAQWR